MISMHIAMVAGDLSGDLLGATLMTALRTYYPNVRFSGIGGPNMISQGLKSLFPLEKLSIMGLVEVLHRGPELFWMRQQIYQYFVLDRPQVFIGIDSPDFNLHLEYKLRKLGIHTVHYVSPSVWAWRPWRVTQLARSAELVLVLFPFEVKFYEQYNIPVCYVGHPLVDYIQLYKYSLTSSEDTQLIALLPGSRLNEIRRMGILFFDTASWLLTKRPYLKFIIPAATMQIYAELIALENKYLKLRGNKLPLIILKEGKSLDAIAASDVVLVASGTATFETMLLRRPMVVVYRVAAVTALLAKLLVHTPYFALPNILAGKKLVPEFFQQQAIVSNIGPAILHWLENTAERQTLISTFQSINTQLICDRPASYLAAAAICNLLGHSP